MQLNISLDPSNQAEVQSAAALIALFGGPAAEPKTATKPKAKPEPEEEEEEEEPKPKAKPAAKAAAAKTNGKTKPKAEPEEEEEEEDSKALRMEIRGRFAAYAEEVGPLEGKALLDEFDAKKFSDIPDGKLAAFSKRLARLEAEL